MSILNELAGAALILVRVGVVARFIFCMIKLINADDEAAQYKKRAKNAVVFWALAEGVWQIKEIVFHYYGG